MRKICFFLFFMMLSISYSLAQLVETVHVTSPGTLSDYLGTNLTKVTDLTLTGTINDADFTTIQQMTLLKNLDLGAVQTTNNAIPNAAFNGKAYEKLVLPNNLQTIGRESFKSSNIKSMVIPESVTLFDECAFMGAKIAGVDFSRCKNVTRISSRAFASVSDPIDLTPFTSLEFIGDRCFESSTSKVFLPKHLKTTFYDDFSRFKGEVILPEGLPKLHINLLSTPQLRI